MTLQQETARELKSFLDGEQSAEALEAWIIAVEEEGDFSDDEAEVLLELRLMLLEAGEGLRQLDDAKAVAAQLLAEAGVLGPSYSREISTASNSQSYVQGRPGFQVHSVASANG